MLSNIIVGCPSILPLGTFLGFHSKLLLIMILKIALLLLVKCSYLAISGSQLPRLEQHLLLRPSVQRTPPLNFSKILVLLHQHISYCFDRFFSPRPFKE